MKPSIATTLVAALTLSSPAAARNPAAPLSVAQTQTQTQTPVPSSPRQKMQPVPGYKFIAGAILLGIGGIIFAFTQQDGTPDSN